MVMTFDDKQTTGTRLWSAKASWNHMQELLHPGAGESKPPIDILVTRL